MPNCKCSQPGLVVSELVSMEAIKILVLHSLFLIYYGVICLFLLHCF